MWRARTQARAGVGVAAVRLLFGRRTIPLRDGLGVRISLRFGEGYVHRGGGGDLAEKIGGEWRIPVGVLLHATLDSLYTPGLGKTNPEPERTSLLARCYRKCYRRRLDGVVRTSREGDKMKYERAKWASTVFSGVGVLLSLFGAAVVTDKAAVLDKYVAVSVIAAVLAAVGAAYSIWLSRRLERDRDTRRVFIVYARPDIETAQRVAAELRDIGVDPWLDMERLEPGSVWREEVFKALQSSSAAVVLLSNNFQHSELSQRELRAAMGILKGHGTQSPVIPVRIDESEVPDMLRHIQWVDLSHPEGFAHLRSGVRSAVEPVAQTA